MEKIELLEKLIRLLKLTMAKSVQEPVLTLDGNIGPIKLEREVRP